MSFFDATATCTLHWLKKKKVCWKCCHPWSQWHILADMCGAPSDVGDSTKRSVCNKKNLMFHCESAWIQARNKEPTAYRHLQEPRLVCSSSRWEQEGSRRAAVAPPSLTPMVTLFCTTSGTKTSSESHSRVLMISMTIVHPSIARWAGCLCPCATQTERSPCPSGGLSWGPLGCRALTPRPQTLAARASTPAKSSRGPRHSRLQRAHKTWNIQSIATMPSAKK